MAPAGAGARLRLRLFGIQPEEATFRARGFVAGEPAAQLRLEAVGSAFVHGYRAGLVAPGPHAAEGLTHVAHELSGFAFEGAAMALGLLDLLAPWRRRWAAFVAGPAHRHVYMAHVGRGWAYARLGRCPKPGSDGLEPLLGNLAVDGYGFHHGYFEPGRYGQGAEPPRAAKGNRAAFDQGLGRSLWFINGGRADRCAAAVGRFAENRREDLWSGLGLAAAYAGPADGSIDALADASGGHRSALAQGVAFAAKARCRAGNGTADSEVACTTVWGLPAASVATITDLALGGIDSSRPGNYEVWRRRIMAAHGSRPQ